MTLFWSRPTRVPRLSFRSPESDARQELALGLFGVVIIHSGRLCGRLTSVFIFYIETHHASLG